MFVILGSISAKFVYKNDPSHKPTKPCQEVAISNQLSGKTL